MTSHRRTSPFARSIKTALVIALAAGFAAGQAQAADEYALDPSHSAVLFEVDHFGFAKVFGRFDTVSGKISLDQGNVGKSSAVIVIDAASLSTGVGDRDDHLRGPDFFNTDEFPTIEFRSTSAENAGEGLARLKGHLTLLGMKKPVTLDVKLNRVAPHPMRPGVEVAGFSATTTIDRTDFGMRYGVGGIGSEVVIRIEVEAHKK